MPNDKDFSIEDEAYLHAIAAEPKMTTDELVGDDGNQTLDPFTAKGSLAYSLDEALSADTDLEHTTVTRDKNDGLDSHLTDPTDDFRDETKGELEGSTDTPQNLLQPIESNKVNEGLKPMIQQDSATPAKESLAYALDSITMDGAEEIEKKPPVGKDPQPDYSDYSEENASHIDFKAPNIPQSMGGDEDKPDANGLVYVSATFTVDPEKYISNNYRPSNTAQAPNAQDVLKKASAAMRSQGQEQQAANPEEEETLSDLGTPEAKESAMQPTEPTEQQEEQAAKDADKEQKKELDAEAEEERKAVIPKASDKDEKPAQDEAIDKVVLDYATFIDGSSFMCFDEISDIDYTKIAMDAGPKKPVTRQNCQTTFAQCRAKNPLFCRFHGPKLLEADIKTAIKATVGNGCVVSVTKDSAAKNKFTFRLTVGCPPSKKMMVEKMIHMYLTQNPGISSSTEDWNLAGKHKQTMEFDMDLLRADKPPEKNDIKGKKAVIQTKNDKAAKKVQGVVGETAPALEKKAAKGEKWKTVDEAVESEWADVVDKNVNKSLLANNQEFIDAFNKIANDFDAAHDKGDAEGLKKALDALKAEIGKYDENGEKKEGADGGEAEAQPTEGMPTEEKPIEQAQPAEQPTQPSQPAEEPQPTKPSEADEDADEGNDKGGESREGVDGGKGFTPPNPMEEPEFYEAWNEANKPMLNDSFEEAKASIPEGIGNDKIDPLIEDFNKAMGNYDFDGAKKAIKGLTALANGDNGGSSPSTTKPADKGDSIKLPPISPKREQGGKSSEIDDVLSVLSSLNKEIPDFNFSYDATNAVQSGDPKQVTVSAKGTGDYDAMLGKVDSMLANVGYGVQTTGDGRLKVVKKGIEAESSQEQMPEAKKVADLMSKVDELSDKAKELGIDGDEAVANHKKNCAYFIQEIGYSTQSVDTITAKLQEEEDKPDSPLVELAKTCLTNALQSAKDGLESKIMSLENFTQQFADYIDTYQKDSVDKAKLSAADSVESSIKNLSAYIFGGKRPPKGVDSVGDYIDYQYDAMQTAAKDGGLSIDEVHKMEDTYHVGDAMEATKAASKQMDDLIEEFKDKMDSPPTQSEDYGSYQADIEQMNKSIKAASVELMTAHDAFKTAIEKCNYEAAEAKKLAESKKKLGGGGDQVKPFDFDALENGQQAQGTQGVEETKQTAQPTEQAHTKAPLTEDEKKAKIAAMSPKQKLEAAVKIFKKKLAADPNNAEAKAKLAKYEAMLSKLNK